MDADKRHELKQNELAEALRGMADFSDKRTWTWLAAIAAVALMYAGYKYVGWQARTQRAEIAQQLSSISVTDATLGEKPFNDLRDLLARAKDPGTRSLIRMKLAEGLELAAKGPAGAPKLAEAEAEYLQIVNMQGVTDSVKAPALYRLGLLCETKRDFAKAREYLGKLGEDPRYLGSPFVEFAKERLGMLDSLAVPVVFAPGNKPAAPAPPVDESQMKSVLVPAQPMIKPVPAAQQPGEKTPEPQNAPAEPTEEPEKPEQP